MLQHIRLGSQFDKLSENNKEYITDTGNNFHIEPHNSYHLTLYLFAYISSFQNCKHFKCNSHGLFYYFTLITVLQHLEKSTGKKEGPFLTNLSIHGNLSPLNSLQWKQISGLRGDAQQYHHYTQSNFYLRARYLERKYSTKNNHYFLVKVDFTLLFLFGLHSMFQRYCLKKIKSQSL